ncbi:unnamed protein product, partial [Heterotrigona itama]
MSMITGAVQINDRLVTRLWEKLSIRQLNCRNAFLEKEENPDLCTL